MKFTGNWLLSYPWTFHETLKSSTSTRQLNSWFLLQKYFTTKNCFKQHRRYQMETSNIIKACFSIKMLIYLNWTGCYVYWKQNFFINFVLISINCYSIDKHFDFDTTCNGQTWLIHKNMTRKKLYIHDNQLDNLQNIDIKPNTFLRHLNIKQKNIWHMTQMIILNQLIQI